MIESQSLRYAYPTGTTIEFPDVVLAQGAVAVLSGASGSGKSTWLALACGLLSATAGRMVVADQDLGALHGAARDAWRGRTVGFLPQRLYLSPYLTVQENLAMAYFAADVREDLAHISRCLDALGVANLAHRKPAQLSGGQAQRVALARAVLLSPQVVLADEPTASLDDAAAAQATGLLVQQAQRCHATLVIATHDARVAQALHTVGCTFQTIKMHNLPEAITDIA